VFSTVTTIVLGFQNSTDVLDAGLSAVNISSEPYVNPAVMQGNGSIIDLTGYSGADVPLGIGQTAIYDVAASNPLLFRIATGNNQEYEITGDTDFIGGSTIGTSLKLQPNNANTGAAAVVNHFVYANNTTNSVGFSTNDTFFLSQGNTLVKFRSRIMTRTTGKYATGDWLTRDALLWYFGTASSVWTDTTTAWTSLGTLTFQNVLNARIRVTRLM
jgi:hypothetical protein